MTIVKVQIPISTNTTPMALIYGKGRTNMCYRTVTDDVKKAMNGRFKAFFEAKIEKDKVEVLFEKPAPDQDW